MKWSKYNIVFELSNDKVGIFNSFKNSFIALSKETYQDVKKPEGEQIQIDKLPEDLLNSLIENKNIVESENEVINILKFKSYQDRFRDDVLDLAIAPTMDCNFYCFYCFEKYKHADYMTEETENNIIKYIQSFKADKLHILWFGGEPLLNFKSIKNISRKLFENQYDFEASIITNGYLLTKEKVDLLKSLNINSVQISLDGVGDVHNKRRTHKKGYETFDKIIENLDYLVKYAADNSVLVSIKVTVDKDNKQAFPDVFEYIRKRYPKELEQNVINVDVNFVNSSSNNDVSSCVLKSFDKIEYYKYLLDIGFDKKYVGFLLEPRLAITECMMRAVNSFGIGPNGYLYKCLEDFGNHDKTVGNINTRTFNNELFAKLTVAEDIFDNKTCTECSVMPVCGGGCPYSRLNNENEKKNDGFHCTMYKGHLSELLKMYYETV
jgi:uncharacterized protein